MTRKPAPGPDPVAPAPRARAVPRAAIRRVPADPQSAPAGVAEVEIRRSARRTRSVSAYREGSRVVVLVPARSSGAEEDRWVTRMLERLARSASRAAMGADDLQTRAAQLSARYLPGVPRPASVAWSARQQLRWGSCTPADRSIRLSERLRGMPRWVIDYVLVHELAHLVHADHGAGFTALVARYPHADRARGFLDGVSFAADLPAAYPSGSDPAAGEDAGFDPPAADGSGFIDDPAAWLPDRP
jgi:hypothetical protein